MNSKIKCPFVLQVSGPSLSGKTYFTCQFLSYQKYLLETPSQNKIRWYSPHSSLPLKVPNVKLISHLPWTTAAADAATTASEEEEEGESDNEADEENENEHSIIVIDDFAQELSNSKELTNFFTKNAHHKNTSVIFLVQNLFQPGPYARTRSLNIHYFVIMKQARDRQQLATLARQITRNKEDYEVFIKAYDAATGGATPYSYLLVSLHPRDEEELLLRSHLFPEEANSPSVYLSAKKYKYYKSAQARTQTEIRK